MDTARRVLAILMMVTCPPAIVYWFVVHPFAAFWRRVGVTRTYLVLIAGMVIAFVIIFRYRVPLLGHDFGTSWPLVLPGAALYFVAGWIELRVRKHLSFRMLAGVPEVAGESSVMLDSGIYSRIRHPRYTSFLCGVAGMALFSNYAGAYLLALACVPSIVVIARLEEGELRQRFGERYGEYARRVPAFIPRPG